MIVLESGEIATLVSGPAVFFFKFTFIFSFLLFLQFKKITFHVQFFGQLLVTSYEVLS